MILSRFFELHGKTMATDSRASYNYCRRLNYEIAYKLIDEVAGEPPDRAANVNLWMIIDPEGATGLKTTKAGRLSRIIEMI